MLNLKGQFSCYKAHLHFNARFFSVKLCKGGLLFRRQRHISPLLCGQRREMFFSFIELSLQLNAHAAITLAGLLLQLFDHSERSAVMSP